MKKRAGWKIDPQKRYPRDYQPSYRGFLDGSDGNWLAAAPDGMLFFHPVLIRW